ncbi:MAG: S41 family peptidase [Candidatus Xenobiia bacterium LiM19]
MKHRESIWIILTLLLLFSVTVHCSSQQQALKTQYIKECLNTIATQISRNFVNPVSDAAIYTGAAKAMQKVDPAIKNTVCRSWTDFESLLDNAINRKPALSSALGEAAIKGMVKSLQDPYSIFLDNKQWEYYRNAMNGQSFAGIGVELAVKNGQLIITTPLKGSPAEKAGIQPGDLIVKVNGVSCAGREYDEVLNSFDGEKGSAITLTLKRGETVRDFTVVRDFIRFEPVSARIIGTSPPVGYISIPYFGSKTDSEVMKALNAMTAKGVTRLIIDLRGDPGGDFAASQKIAGFFVQNGIIIKVQKRGGQPQDILAQKRYSYSFRTAVLINEGSASAAEVLACSLADNRKAILIGTRSFGKGLVQTIFPLPGNTALKLSTSKYLTPRGVDIHMKGLSPAVVVQSRYPFPKISDDPVVLKAVEILGD